LRPTLDAIATIDSDGYVARGEGDGSFGPLSLRWYARTLPGHPADRRTGGAV